MALLNINNKPKEDKPIVQAVSVQQDNVIIFKDKVPANWSLSQNIDGRIIGINLNSGESFSGTMKEFNTALRG
jgi:hypothetical protein